MGTRVITVCMRVVRFTFQVSLTLVEMFSAFSVISTLVEEILKWNYLSVGVLAHIKDEN